MACGTLAVRSFKGQLKVITAVAIYNYNCAHEKFQIEIDAPHVVNEDEVGVSSLLRPKVLLSNQRPFNYRKFHN